MNITAKTCCYVICQYSIIRELALPERVKINRVSGRNLAGDESLEPVNHPLVDEFFSGFRGGIYLTGRHSN